MNKFKCDVYNVAKTTLPRHAGWLAENTPNDPAMAARYLLAVEELCRVKPLFMQWQEQNNGLKEAVEL